MTETERSRCGALCQKYWPADCRHRIQIAEDALKQRFLFDLPWDMEQTAEAVVFSGPIDWQYMPKGDPEFIYQFNRHRYWICLGQAWAMTGEERYAACFRAQLLSWLEENPIDEPHKGTTWRTIEAGIRGENWVKAMELFEGWPGLDETLRERFAQGLLLHGEFLMAHQPPFSDKSNWGVLESHGLFDIGAYLKQRTRFTEQGEHYLKEAVIRLERELNIQRMADGVHWEQSPMYHNEVLRCVLEVLRMAERIDRPLPSCLREHARAMAYADLAWMKPDGTQPCFGDSDQTELYDVLLPAAWLLKDRCLRAACRGPMDFESIWDFGSEAALAFERWETTDAGRNELEQRSFAALEESGHYILRSGWEKEGSYLHFACGSLGGGHGHFDKLHVDLVIGGEDVLVDSGRYTYVDGVLRRGLKASAAHNVPILDGKEYARCTGSWNAVDGAAAFGNAWCRKGIFTLLQGGHLGYLTDGVLVSRRILAIGTDLFVLLDRFEGRTRDAGSHLCSQRFHFNPAGRVIQTSHGFSYQGKNAEADFLVLTPGAQFRESQAPVSFHYNQLTEGSCVSVEASGELPLTMITIIAGYPRAESGVSEITGKQHRCQAELTPLQVPVTGRTLEMSEGIGIRVRCLDRSWLIVLRFGEATADGEYIGALGHYGLGRIMACEESQSEPMQVLQW